MPDRFAPAERDAVADLLLELGPDAPTLCEGWTTRDLAAHLVLRASRVDAAGGILLKPLAGRTRRVQAKIATRPWEKLVGQVRRRPWWAPGALDEAANRMEYFVHHEDVRRAQPGWRPRALSAGMVAALWSSVHARARLVLRRTPAAVTVAATGFGSFTAGRGGPAVTLSGDPGELLMFLFGRQSVARVSLEGPEEIVARMRRSRFGP